MRNNYNYLIRNVSTKLYNLMVRVFMVFISNQPEQLLLCFKRNPFFITRMNNVNWCNYFFMNWETAISAVSKLGLLVIL